MVNAAAESEAAETAALEAALAVAAVEAEVDAGTGTGAAVLVTERERCAMDISSSDVVVVGSVEPPAVAVPAGIAVDAASITPDSDAQA
mmetsp:Transcript_45294/g.96336  ORF Transcript_45294/g.96336 Transcript_45294/m.96336 type:complete len:89 (-) Transcript_45294:1278-1544(-)